MEIAVPIAMLALLGIVRAWVSTGPPRPEPQHEQRRQEIRPAPSPGPGTPADLWLAWDAVPWDWRP